MRIICWMILAIVKRQELLEEEQEGEHAQMFFVVSGMRRFKVYAVSGSMFLIWNDSADDGYWEWVPMENYRPEGN